MNDETEQSTEVEVPEQVEPAQPEAQQAEEQPSRPRFKPCRIKGCDNPGKNKATGYCTEHYGRYVNAKRVGAVT